jgi:uncharacterized protein
MFVVDTNILVYAANEDTAEHETCKACVENWCRQPGIWHVTWGILYEFMRVVTHPRVFPRPWSAGEAWAFVDTLLSSPGLAVLTEKETHRETAAEFFREHPFVSGNLLFDTHTAILMKEHGIGRIYSRDTDFHRFPSIRVIDPLK